VNDVTLDSGALIAFERGDREAGGIVARVLAQGDRLAVPAGVVGQVWRSGARQARLARLLASEGVDILPLDDAMAREAGQLCGARGAHDAIDASVAIVARRRGGTVVTSDPDDIARLDPTLRIVSI
jgi:predicted nucleic acid-binding protein